VCAFSLTFPSLSVMLEIGVAQGPTLDRPSVTGLLDAAVGR
jgi:hypothetical protein